MNGFRLAAALSLVSMVAVGLAQQSVAVPNVSVNFGSGKETGDVSTSLQILALLTILSVAPALLILTTAFSRIVIIFGFVRNALGTQTIPPNQVLVGLSLFLTFYVMGPTYTTIYDSALKPYMAGEMKFDEASERAQKPLRAFMLKNTYEKDLRLFIDVRGGETPTPENIPLTTLIPAFVISELKTAFIVGFYIFIPFVIIDLVVASGLMSMGMMMMPPTVVSLPAKILVFVLADGWSLLVSTILSGYR